MYVFCYLFLLLLELLVSDFVYYILDFVSKSRIKSFKIETQREKKIALLFLIVFLCVCGGEKICHSNWIIATILSTFMIE